MTEDRRSRSRTPPGSRTETVELALVLESTRFRCSFCEGPLLTRDFDSWLKMGPARYSIEDMKRFWTKVGTGIYMNWGEVFTGDYGHYMAFCEECMQKAQEACNKELLGPRTEVQTEVDGSQTEVDGSQTEVGTQSIALWNSDDTTVVDGFTAMIRDLWQEYLGRSISKLKHRSLEKASAAALAQVQNDLNRMRMEAATDDMEDDDV
jgi:hypothetical protein